MQHVVDRPSKTNLDPLQEKYTPLLSLNTTTLLHHNTTTVQDCLDNMKESAEINTEDGIKLFTRSWTIESPKAIVYFHHGLGEHIDRYANAFQNFNEAGIQVHGFDCRGHGRTLQLNKGMAKCHISEWRNTVNDIRLLTETYPSDKPKFLVNKYNQGMGLILCRWDIRWVDCWC